VSDCRQFVEPHRIALKILLCDAFFIMQRLVQRAAGWRNCFGRWSFSSGATVFLVLPNTDDFLCSRDGLKALHWLQTHQGVINV
jgi:hypothetical protein